MGVAGIDGNGQRELEEVLAGVRAPLAGHLEVDGRATPFGTRAFRAAGVAHLSGDRERAGLVGAMTVAENLVLKSSYDDRRFFRLLRYDVAAADAHARDRIAAFGIVPPEPARAVALLSGGNAQKVAVARELEGAPGALVAVNPTRGLDVGSARFVHEQLLALARARERTPPRVDGARGGAGARGPVVRARARAARAGARRRRSRGARRDPSR